MASSAAQDLSHAPSVIAMKGVNKWYGQFHVLTDINLDVKLGEKIVVCGPSGSGKSTLIRCINRLEEHQQGDIIVDGVTLNRPLAPGTVLAIEGGLHRDGVLPGVDQLEPRALGLLAPLPGVAAEERRKHRERGRLGPDVADADLDQHVVGPHPGGGNVLHPDPGLRPGFDQGPHQATTHSSRPTRVKAAMARSRW